MSKWLRITCPIADLMQFSLVKAFDFGPTVVFRREALIKTTVDLTHDRPTVNYSAHVPVVSRQRAGHVNCQNVQLSTARSGLQLKLWWMGRGEGSVAASKFVNYGRGYARSRSAADGADRGGAGGKGHRGAHGCLPSGRGGPG